MPRARKPFSPIEVGEKLTLAFGFGPSIWSITNLDRTTIVFVPQLGVGETIASVSWGCVAYAGADPDAADLIAGLAPDLTIASVTFDAADAVAGATYLIEATATTSLGLVRKASSTILCEASAVPVVPVIAALSFDFTQPTNLVL